MRKSIRIYLDHAKHLTPEQRKWLRDQEAKRANQRRMRYNAETTARMTEVLERVRGARHFVRTRRPDAAQDELMHVINEARKLHLHLQAWDNYV
jgi:hypothetical protein